MLEAGNSPLNSLWNNESHLFIKPEKTIKIQPNTRDIVHCSYRGNEFMIALSKTGKITKTHKSVYRVEIDKNNHFMLVDSSRNRKKTAKIPIIEKYNSENEKRFNSITESLNNDITSNYLNDYEYIKYSLDITPGEFHNFDSDTPQSNIQSKVMHEDLSALLRLTTKLYSVPPGTTSIKLIEADGYNSIVYYLEEKNGTVIDVFIEENSFELVSGKLLNIDKIIEFMTMFLPMSAQLNKICSHEESDYYKKALHNKAVK